jgi:hypothetical protein
LIFDALFREVGSNTLYIKTCEWEKISPSISLRECKEREIHGKAGARWESMRREAESLIKASLVSGSPS